MMQTLWEELVIEAMAIPIRIWLHARKLGEAGNYLELKRLATLALYRELRRHELDEEEMIQLMGCGASTLRRCREGMLSSQENEFYQLLRSALALIDNGQLTQEEIVEAVVDERRSTASTSGASDDSKGREPDSAERTRQATWNVLDVYVRRGLIAVDPTTHILRLKERPEMNASNLVRGGFLSRRLLAYLSAVGQASRDELREYCLTIRPDWTSSIPRLLTEALAVLGSEGLIDGPDEETGVYRTAATEQVMGVRGRRSFREDLYARAPDLFRGVAEFVGSALIAPPGARSRKLLSQRVLHFDCTPEALEAFLSQLNHEHGLLIPAAVALDRHAEGLPLTDDPFDSDGHPLKSRRIRASLLWVALPWDTKLRS